MILGFTGTRAGLTPQQLAVLLPLVATLGPDPLPIRIIHGGAVGADQEFDEILAPAYWARGSGPGRLFTAILGITPPILVHPASQVRRDYWLCDANYAALRSVLTAAPPLARNRLIIGAADRLLACPATPDEVLRSGTWSTIRYARQAGKSVTLVLPDGTVREEPARPTPVPFPDLLEIDR